MKIEYNQSGIRYILNWHTHNKQSRLIVAKSKPAIIKTAEKIIDYCKKQSPYATSLDLQFFNFLKVELVIPSKEIISHLENKIKENNVYEFQRAFLYHIKSLFSKELRESAKRLMMEFPQEFSICDCLEVDCDNCLGSNIKYCHSKYELYNSYYEKYQKIFGNESHYHPINIEIQAYAARQVDNNEKVYCANDLVGTGLRNPILLDSDNFYQNPYFYFVIQESLDITEINYILEKENSLRKEMMAKSKLDRKKQLEIENLAEQLKMLEVLDLK